MFRNYLRSALRNGWNTRILLGINILGLSVALTCCMLILLYTKDENSYDRFHKNKDRIYRVTATVTRADGTTDKHSTTGMITGPGFQRSIPEVEDYVRIMKNHFTIRHNSAIYEQEALSVDSNFFSFFSFPLIAGNPATALSGIRSIVLSWEVAEKYFGKENALGQTLELKIGEDFQPFIVSGIARRSPENSSIKIQMMVPISEEQTRIKDQKWTNFFLNTFVLLTPGSNTASVENKFARVFETDAREQLQQLAGKYNFKNKVRFGLQPLLQMHWSTDFPSRNGLSDASNPLYSYILTGIALFILLIASINFINLTMANSLRRAKEIGVRKVVGGRRPQLMLQFLGESLLLSAISFLLAILLTWLTLPFFNSLANKALSFSYLFDAGLVATYMGLFLVTGLLAGFYPALVMSGFDPIHTLSGRFRLPGRNYLAKGLVVFQFTLATILMMAMGTLFSQFDYITHFDLGYNDRDVVILNAGSRDVIINTGKMDRPTLDVFRQELLRNAAIGNVTADQGGSLETTAHINDGQPITFDFRYIDENYFPLFQIPLLQGRNFSKEFSADTSHVIINESFAKAAGWKDPVGQSVDFYYMNKKYTVIGVIKDYHYASLTEKVGPQLFTTNPAYRYGDIFIKIKPGKSVAALQHIRQTFTRLFPLQPCQYYFKDAHNTARYAQEARWRQIITCSAVLCIFVSCIGLFGLASLSIRQRAKEIGIRKILGASVTGIVKQLSGDFLRLVALAAILATPIAWFLLNRWLQNYPYRIAMDWRMVGFPAMAVLVVAFLTISYQTVRASIANPTVSLKDYSQ